MLKALFDKIKTILDLVYLERISSYKQIEGWLTEKEATTLYKYARKKRNGITIEIGSWKGKSTYCIARGILNGKIYSIDPFNGDGDTASTTTYTEKIRKTKKTLLEIYISNLRKYHQLHKVNICKGYSSEWLSLFTHADLLFIDGDHSIPGCRYDYQNYTRLLSKGGYLLLHDYYPNRKELGSTYVVKKYLLKNSNYKLVEISDSLIVFRRK